jgi:hypothetical protein
MNTPREPASELVSFTRMPTSASGQLAIEDRHGPQGLAHVGPSTAGRFQAVSPQLMPQAKPLIQALRQPT